MISKKAFTLIELIVVVAMIMIIIGAMTAAVSGAQERARIQKAKADVKVITQAILAYENERTGSGDNAYKLPTLNEAICNRANLGFLLGRENDKGGDTIPVLVQAALSGGNGEIRDPWGHPYKVTIKSKTPPKIDSMDEDVDMKTGYILPNFYRLKEGER